MKSHKRTWILVKGTENAPSGSLRLGQVLLKPYEPYNPLLPDNPIPIPASNIEFSHQSCVDIASRSKLSASYKLWAQIDMLPIQANLGGHFRTSDSLTWHFDRLEGQTTVPRLQDVKVAMESEEITAQIRRKKFDFKKRLYMVTGVRIARGARMLQKDSFIVGGDADLGVDLSALGAPGTVGPAGHGSVEYYNRHSFGEVSDFVYAYRLSEIHYGKQVYTEPYNGGETFGANEGEGDKYGDMDMEVDVEGEKVDDRIHVEELSGLDYSGTAPTFNLAVEDDEEGYQFMP